MSRLSLPPTWLPLVASAGSVDALALELGFASPSSVWRWAHGHSRPNRASQLLLLRYCQSHNLSIPHVST
jgi:hypothetical protein